MSSRLQTELSVCTMQQQCSREGGPWFSITSLRYHAQLVLCAQVAQGDEYTQCRCELNSPQSIDFMDLGFSAAVLCRPQCSPYLCKAIPLWCTHLHGRGTLPPWTDVTAYSVFSCKGTCGMDFLSRQSGTDTDTYTD